MTELTVAAGTSYPVQGRARKRGINYLGNLGRMLRDLTGYSTLLFELLQNADDAGAGQLRIDVGQDALTVFNDASFSDCGDQDLGADECLFLSQRGHRCDFHSFCDVASGDKRDRADTTGAFGIGFTAVYQIADTAVLISSGRRWDIDETRPEDSRIIETPEPDAEGTIFVLPWARDPGSAFRRLTGSAAVGPGDPGRLLDALRTDLPAAMLFLRHVREVEVLRDGRREFRYGREEAGELCEITREGESRMWLMLHGDFSQEAADLRGRFPGKIEAKRQATVTVAIPLDSQADGRLCAYLPTDERSGLPAHVNADFYPESDRRHLITDSFHGEWNRIAVRAAAQLIASHLTDLAPRLGHERLWALIFAAYEAKPEGPDTGIAAYWDEIRPILPGTPVMWTTSGEWTAPAGTVFMYSAEEDEVIPVLERLGLKVMHPEAGAYARRMTGRAGARQLSLGLLAQALLDSGLDRAVSLADSPPALASGESREILWRELDRLLGRPAQQGDRATVLRAAVMPGNDGRLWPAGVLRSCDAPTTRLVTSLGIGVQLLDRAALPPGCDRLAGLCQELDLRSLLALLADGENAGRLREALGSGRVTAASVITWLRRSEAEILADPALRERIRGLPICPVSGRHRPLSEVVLPGGFTDRLGIADAIDVDEVSDHLTFLRQLGARPLTLQSYLTVFLPPAANRPDTVADPRWEHLITDIATRLDQFSQDEAVRRALEPLPLVACGSAFLPASSCYFASGVVAAVLGAQTPIARELTGHERSTRSLYEWLGVASEPRLPDVVGRVRLLAAGRPGTAARQAVAAIVRHLGKLVPDRQTPAPDALSPLRDLAWLPAAGDDSWHQPGGLHTEFRKSLFETQGRFIDLPLKVQQDASDLLRWLGVKTNPAISQVIAHLLTQAGRGVPVSRDVYTELNGHADDPEVGRLAGTACLLLPGGVYVKPASVFRQGNPFGRFRQLLGQDFDAIGGLLDRLGVKRLPGAEDARDVLSEIAREQNQRFHLPVEDEDDLAVIWRCWQMLDNALADGEVTARWLAPLGRLPIVPNAAGVLTPPTRLLTDDMPGVAEALRLGDAVIRRREGMWRAVQAAGVRSLTDAVSIEILQIGETTRDGAVRERIIARQAALARIMDKDPDGIERLTAVLGSLSFPESPVLRVRYHLPDFGLSSSETPLKALYVPADPRENSPARLISCPQDDGWPWMLIAKELARALHPGESPGPLAASLYIALSAPSIEAAHSALDDAGWPRLEHVEVTLPDAGPGAGFAGCDESTAQPEAGQPDSAADTPAGQAPTGQPATGAPEADGAASSKPTYDPPSGTGSAGHGEPPYGPGSGNGHQHDPASGGDTAPQRPRTDSSDRREQRRRLRSYVTTGDTGDSGREPADTSLVDEAGVSLVVEAEREAGRHPEVMPHHNPGFDIISRDEAGEILRHIEVKSTSGAWDDMGVGMSRAQFDFARQHRDTFWLYVVEHAIDEDQAHVWRIADPAGRADEFRFDGGWQAVSEDTEF